MSNIAFVGDMDFVRALGALGGGVFGISRKEELPSLFDKLLEDNYRVVFILENLAQTALSLIERYKDRFASVVVIPDYRQDLGICNLGVKRAIVEAVGADMLKGE